MAAVEPCVEEPPQAVRDAVMDAARSSTISFFIMMFSLTIMIMSGGRNTVSAACTYYNVFWNEKVAFG